MHRKLPEKLFHEDSLLRLKKRRGGVGGGGYFPGGPVAKNPPAKAGNGARSHMAPGNAACGPQSLERVQQEPFSAPREASAMRSPRLQRGSGPCSPGPQKVSPSSADPVQPKIIHKGANENKFFQKIKRERERRGKGRDR